MNDTLLYAAVYADTGARRERQRLRRWFDDARAETFTRDADAESCGRR